MFDARQERMMALGYGFAIANYPYPDGDLEGVDRAYVWGAYYSTYPPNPYYEGEHVKKALSRLIEQFKPCPNINSLVRIHAERVQGMEAAAAPLLTRRAIDTAAGDALDIVGEIVGQERGGRTDADYRVAIRFRIAINTSNGEPETVISATRFFTNATRVRYRDMVWVPAHVFLFTDGFTLPDDLYSGIKAIMPAGVSLYLVWHPGEPWFQFGPDYGSSVQPMLGGEGWSEYDYIDPGTGQPVGGKFSELIS